MTTRLRHSVVDALLAECSVDHANVAVSVRAFVDEQLSRMPAHLRLGVVGTELLLSARPDQRIDARIERWSRSRLFPIASYIRLIRGLVVFAAFEHAGR